MSDNTNPKESIKQELKKLGVMVWERNGAIVTPHATVSVCAKTRTVFVTVDGARAVVPSDVQYIVPYVVNANQIAARPEVEPTAVPVSWAFIRTIASALVSVLVAVAALAR